MDLITDLVNLEDLLKITDLRDRGSLDIYILHRLYDDVTEQYVVLWSSSDPRVHTWMALLC